MKILAVRHALPSLAVTNDDVLDRIRHASHGHLETAALDGVETEIRSFLARAGTEVRYTLGPGETAHGLMSSAVAQAIATAGVSPRDIDLVIYAGVSRGWLEPSMACAIQDQAGIGDRATCFDVLEACASWIRAMQITSALFQAGSHRLALIVNCECAYAHMAPWTVTSPADLEYTMAAYTVGEAATATVISAEAAAGKVEFFGRSYGQHHRLCMIPLDSAENYGTGPADRPATGSNVFFSYAQELVSLNMKYLVDEFRKTKDISGVPCDRYFSHSVSAKAGRLFQRQANIPLEKWYCTHARYGNTVSASIPLALSCALDDGFLQRGHRVLTIVGSAGISIAFMRFTF